MRYFSLVIVFLSSTVSAQTSNDDWLSEVIEKQKHVTQKMSRDGSLDSFQQKSVESDISKFLKEAQEIADSSHITQEKKQTATNQLFGKTAKPIDALSNVKPTNETTRLKRSLSVVFVSFSMSNTEMRDAFLVAEQFGAEVYFNGMHQEDDNIMDTMNRIKRIMANVDAKPRARFHPKAFSELNVKHVPVLFHAETGNVGYVSGLLNFDWLKRQMGGLKGVRDFGKMGPTDPVEEKNIIHELQQRLMNMDMDEKKKKAVDGFWRKQQFVSLPDNTESKVYFINPTVRVSQDIVNPNGDILAKAGQVLNPITSAPTQNTYYLFDANNNEHVEWALSHVDHSFKQGVQMFLTESINPNDGWTHLSSLRKRFAREIYLIPKTMVERFKITGLPAKVSTDISKGLLRIELINLKEGSK